MFEDAVFALVNTRTRLNLVLVINYSAVVPPYVVQRQVGCVGKKTFIKSCYFICCDKRIALALKSVSD